MQTDEISALLHRIATDTDFRGRVEKDPIKTLGAVGIKIAPEDVPKEGVKLPDNQEILRNLDQLAQRFGEKHCESHELHELWDR